MFLKRLWRFLKKAFGKKRPASQRRHRTRPRKKHVAAKTRPGKKPSSRPSKRKTTPLKKDGKKPAVRAVLAGTITHYFPKVNAAVIQLEKPLHVGEPVLIKGPKTEIRQTVGSMQINRSPIEKAKAGQEIGLEVFKEVRPGDSIYLIKE